MAQHPPDWSGVQKIYFIEGDWRLLLLQFSILRGNFKSNSKGCVLNIDWFFCKGAYAAPLATPGGGYPSPFCDAGAWVSASGWCQAVFRRNVWLLLPFFYGMSNQIFRRISHIGVLSLIAIAIHYTPNPSIFSNYQSMFSTEPFKKRLKNQRWWD